MELPCRWRAPSPRHDVVEAVCFFNSLKTIRNLAGTEPATWATVVPPITTERYDSATERRVLPPARRRFVPPESTDRPDARARCQCGACVPLYRRNQV